MKKLLTVAVAALMSITLAGCGNGGDSNKASTASSDSTKKIVALTNSGYPKYEERTPSGELVGFDIDLMNAIGKELGYEIEWKDIDFDALIGALQAGQGDLVIAGMSPDPKRAEEVDFSEIYYQSEEETANFVLCKKDSGIKETADIKGKIAGVQIGTIQESAVNEIKDEYSLEVENRKSYGDLVQEVNNGRIDFVVFEKAIADEYLANNENLMLFQLITDAANSTGNAIAFKKGNDALREDINKVIKKMQENGEMQVLVDKWFGAGSAE